MSDFDDVLERLLTDPGFQARLAADPGGALAGYTLSADELELLQAQVGGGGAGQSRVEQRTSKASMFGLFSSIGSGIGDVVHGHGGGHGLGDGGQGAGAGQSAVRGLGALEQSGGRHAAVEPGDQPGGLAAHLRGAVEHAAHPQSGGVEAHAGPGGAYASAGGATAQAGYGLAEASDQHAGGYGGLTEASDQQAGYGGPAEAPDPRAYASAGHGGLGEASDPRGAGGLGADGLGIGGLGEAEPYGVTEVDSSGGGTVYRSTASLGEAAGQGQHAGFGAAEGGAGQGRHGIAGALDGIGGAAGGGAAGMSGAGVSGAGVSGAGGGAAGMGGPGGIGGALRDGIPNGAGQAPTDGYHTRVDWDGDGTWDQHTYVNRADGGVDIVVDTDGDGRAEFVGHDTDRDGLINSSEIDTNHDGVMDQRYEDLNGDGWLDRRTR